MHGEAQVRKGVPRGFVGGLFFHAALHPEEAFAQGLMLLLVSQLVQKVANMVRASPGFFDQPHGGGECDAAGIRLLEDATLEQMEAIWQEQKKKEKKDVR